MSLNISRRCAGITASLTLKIDSKAKEMAAAGLPVIGFGAGEPDFDTPEYIRIAAKHAIDSGMTRYTPSEGTLALREQICAKLAAENRLAYKPSQIIVGNGAKHVLSNILFAILDDGDEVIIPSPCWVSYPEMVAMAGGTPILAHASEENCFVLTAEELEKYVSKRTKAIIINSPGNPCGNVWSREALEQAAKLAQKYDLYIIADEIYEKLIYDGCEHVSIAGISPDAYSRTILVNGVSKVFAMTGWRIGYAAGPREVIKAMCGFQSHAASNPNSIAQYASQIALRDQDDEIISQWAETFRQRRDVLCARINSIPGVSCKVPQGSFYVMMNISGVMGKHYGQEAINGSVAFADALLRDQYVAVVPGIAFASDKHVRMSYATSLEKITQGMERIENFIQKLR